MRVFVFIVILHWIKFELKYIEIHTTFIVSRTQRRWKKKELKISFHSWTFGILINIISITTNKHSNSYYHFICDNLHFLFHHFTLGFYCCFCVFFFKFFLFSFLSGFLYKIMWTINFWLFLCITHRKGKNTT